MKKKAFTLIELLIVIAIIAILALIAIPNFLEAQTRSKVSRVRADIRSLATGLEAYYVDYNNYPPNYGVGQEMQSFYHITTPVAYLTSIPSDVFNQNKEIIKKSFVYHPNDANSTANQLLWNAISVKWTITSYGPDLDDDQLWQNPHLWPTYTYDPTNGTISNGDIGRSNATSY